MALWAVYLTPVWFSSAGIAVLLYRAHADWWHWGTVAAVSFAILCEAWHGYCRYCISRIDESYGSENQFIRPIPILDRLVVRGEWTGEITDVDGEGYEVYLGRGKIARAWLDQSSLVKGAGRLALVGFVLAGFAARQFSIPWIEFAT